MLIGTGVCLPSRTLMNREGNPAMPTDLAYSIPGLMKATNLGRTLIYEEIKSGRLQIIKCGRRTLITPEQAADWLKRLEADTAASAPGTEDAT